MNKYVIGLDGGGTKTTGILFDSKGKQLNRIEKGFSSFSIDESIALVNIEVIIDELYNSIPVKDFKLVIILGVAGVSKMSGRTGFILDIAEKYNAEVRLESDALLALYSIKKDSNDNIILAIGGTGSIVMTHEQNIQKYGGYGHLLGDEGSAYHVVISAFRRTIKHFERRKMDIFDQMLLRTISANNREDIIKYIYNHSKSDIAKLAKQISYFAEEGILPAIKLLQAEGKLLAKQVAVAYRNLKNKKEIVIGLKGGFILKAPYVKEAFEKELENHIPNYRLAANDTEPVIGAYYLAKDYCGGE